MEFYSYLLHDRQLKIATIAQAFYALHKARPLSCAPMQCRSILASIDVVNSILVSGVSSDARMPTCTPASALLGRAMCAFARVGALACTACGCFRPLVRVCTSGGRLLRKARHVRSPRGRAAHCALSPRAIGLRPPVLPRAAASGACSGPLVRLCFWASRRCWRRSWERRRAASGSSPQSSARPRPCWARCSASAAPSTAWWRSRSRWPSFGAP